MDHTRTRGGSRVKHQIGVTHETDPVFDHSLDPHEFLGRVTTSSFESDQLRGNNTSRMWSFKSLNTDDWYWRAAGNYTLVVSVDNPAPSPGETVNFTVTTAREERGLTARATSRIPAPPIDLEVAINLSTGLAVTGDPTFASRGIGGARTPPDSVSYNNGVFTVGTLKGGTRDQDPDPTQNSVTLPITVASSANVNEQCLTATLTGNPPPGTGPVDDDISDNVAELCLTEAGALGEPFVSGQFDTFSVYPCVGVADPPCDGTDDIRVRAVNPSNGQVSAPGSALIQVHPTRARIYDAKTGHSVNDGNTVSWQTAVNPSRPYGDGLSSGVELYYSRTPYSGNTTGWGGLTFGISARDLDGNIPPPGKVFLRSTSSGNEIRKAESPDYQELRTAPTGTSTPTTKLNYFLEFEKLGIYKVTWHAVANRSSLHGSENCNPDTADPPVNQNFCATETYTFYVGPMAELTVADGGANSHVPANWDALTIVAVNNGPDEPSGGARVTGLPNGAEVLHISHGSYNASTGVWNIDRLRVRDYYRSAGMSEPTLVLGASAGDAVRVTIASAKDYEVCVGPKSNPGDLDHTTQAACEAVTNASWNSVPVYDYKPGNNSATISARAGTGAALISMPETEAIAAIRVTWDPVTEVNGREVTHYEVQRRTNPWETVAKVLDPVYHDLVDDQADDSDPVPVEYLDWNVELGDIHEYRIRAVNDQDYSGPWSSSVEGEVPLPPEPPEPPAVVRPPITEPTRILRIEPSISDVSLKGGSVVRLAVEVYGRQDLRDDSLGDRSDVTFDWTLEEFGAQPGGTAGRLVGTESSNNDRSRISTLDGRRVLYIAPDSPGRFRITVSLDPGTECLPKQSFETEEEAQERCTAVFEVTALRSSQIETAALDPRNPEGEIPTILADSNGLQYEVFTPVSGGAFVHESASLTAGAGAVPNYDMIGLRISNAGPASNEEVTYGRYTLGGDWYAITAVDASGQRVEEAYELNSTLDVCLPLPVELRSNISDLALVALDPSDELTILSSRVRLSTSGTSVCGHLSTVPADIAVGTSGVNPPRPVPIATVEASGNAGSPDTGGMTLPSVAVAFWMAVIGLAVVATVVGLLLHRRRERMARRRAEALNYCRRVIPGWRRR